MGKEIRNCIRRVKPTREKRVRRNAVIARIWVLGAIQQPLVLTFYGVLICEMSFWDKTGVNYAELGEFGAGPFVVFNNRPIGSLVLNAMVEALALVIVGIKLNSLSQMFSE